MTQGRRLTDRECEAAAALRRRGMTYGEIADSLGVCLQTALKRCRTARERGMDCPEDVRRMRSKSPSNRDLLALIEAGASAKRIAAAAGVPRTTAYYWINRAKREERYARAALTGGYHGWVLVQTALGWYAERSLDKARVRVAPSAMVASAELNAAFHKKVDEVEGGRRT